MILFSPCWDVLCWSLVIAMRYKFMCCSLRSLYEDRRGLRSLSAEDEIAMSAGVSVYRLHIIKKGQVQFVIWTTSVVVQTVVRTNSCPTDRQRPGGGKTRHCSKLIWINCNSNTSKGQDAQIVNVVYNNFVLVILSYCNGVSQSMF